MEQICRRRKVHARGSGIFFVQTVQNKKQFKIDFKKPEMRALKSGYLLSSPE